MKNYVSTRGGQKAIGFHEAILQGIADDGGLLVPDFELPKVNLADLLPLDYVSLASKIISLFAPDESLQDISSCCKGAYGSGLFPEAVVPLKEAGDLFVAELFHGKTAAFKDLALSILPRFLSLSIGHGGVDKVLILTATSGDTGKAALEGFKDVHGTEIMVFYPTDGVSEVQKRQMITQEGGNVKVIGIKGNFDDAQRAVKEAFTDKEVKSLCREKAVYISSANSINIGRLLPQIVYYFSSYLELVRRGVISLGDKIRFSVPSGNFGDCLAGWMAGQMGLPVEKFLVASNRNKVLCDFFRTGRYDISGREFHKTIAPAMDILVSSNLERLLWYLEGKDSRKVLSFMESLRSAGSYQVGDTALSVLKDSFAADFSDDNRIMKTIRECYENTGYVLDTHTACAYGFAKEYAKEHGDSVKTVILSTASPYKFADSVYYAITGEKAGSFEAIDKLHGLTGVDVPEALRGLQHRAVTQKDIISKDGILRAVEDYLSKEECL